MKIARSPKYNMIAGVMGGIAEHMEWNVSILRVLFVIVSISSAAFPGILAYLILWMIMPTPSEQQLFDRSPATQHKPDDHEF